MPEEVRKALSKERLGGTCLINFCAGGETLLHPKVVDYIRALLEEGHYVMVVTNGSINKRFEVIESFNKELFRRLFFKFSYHYRELKYRNKLDDFFANINKMHSSGASFTLELTPSDDDIPFIDEIKRRAIENVGAVNHVTIARDERVDDELPILTNMNREDYKKTWGVFHSSLFDYKMSIFGKKRREFCYAGAWASWLNLGDGKMRQCLCSHYDQNIFEDLNKPIRFLPIGNNCSHLHCYNGHSYIALGVIPELQAPSYTEFRNRIKNDGSEWLYPEMKSFMETKLYESNQEYSKWQKLKVNLEIKSRRVLNLSDRLARKVKRKLIK
jgi:hypothetical protein